MSADTAHLLAVVRRAFCRMHTFGFRVPLNTHPQSLELERRSQGVMTLLTATDAFHDIGERNLSAGSSMSELSMMEELLYGYSICFGLLLQAFRTSDIQAYSPTTSLQRAPSVHTIKI